MHFTDYMCLEGIITSLLNVSELGSLCSMQL